MRRSTSRAKVDLPDPLSPTSPRVVPAITSRSTPSTARTAPVLRRSTPLRMGNSLTRSVTVITGSTLASAAALHDRRRRHLEPGAGQGELVLPGAASQDHRRARVGPGHR